MEEIIGTDFIIADNSTVKYATFKESKLICVYFSAHWCPPCRNFTPLLTDAYNKINNPKKIEVVFVSRDKDLESYNGYKATMPWVSIPFANDRIKKLCNKFNLTGIPTLVVMDNKGNIKCEDGYELIMSKGEKAFEEWMVGL